MEDKAKVDTAKVEDKPVKSKAILTAKRISDSAPWLKYLILPVIAAIMLSGCNILPEPTTAIEAAGEVGEVVVHNSLIWWQWIIIGMFIPSPLDIIAATMRFFKPI